MSYSSAFSQAVSIMLYVHVKIQHEHFEYLSTKRIAESLSIPAPTATKVIQKLNAANLLSSKTGVDGGMALVKPIQEVTLYEVFQAVEQGKPLFKMHSEYHIQGDVVEHAKARLADAVNQTENAMHNKLKEIYLMDLLQ